MCLGMMSALAVAVCAGLYPLMPSGWAALAVLAPMLFMASFPLAAAAATLQQVTLAPMRAQVSALFLFTTSLIGYSLGPTAVAVVTDYAFGNDAAVRYSLAIVSATAMLLSAAVLGAGLAPFRRLAVTRS